MTTVLLRDCGSFPACETCWHYTMALHQYYYHNQQFTVFHPEDIRGLNLTLFWGHSNNSCISCYHPFDFFSFYCMHLYSVLHCLLYCMSLHITMSAGCALWRSWTEAMFLHTTQFSIPFVRVNCSIAVECNTLSVVGSPRLELTSQAERQLLSRLNKGKLWGSKSPWGRTKVFHR